MTREPSLYLDRHHIVWVILNHITSPKEVASRGKDSTLHLHFEHSVEQLDLDSKVLFVRHHPSTEQLRPCPPDRDNTSSNTTSSSSSTTTHSSCSSSSSLFLKRQQFDGLIAADGANSCIRRWLQEMGEINVEEEDIPNHYRTFSIPLLSHDATQILGKSRREEKRREKKRKEKKRWKTKTVSSFVLVFVTYCLSNSYGCFVSFCLCLASVIYVQQQQKKDPDRVHGWMLGDKTCLMVPNKFGTASGVFIYPREDDPFEDMDVDSPHEVQAYFERISPKPYGLSKFIGPDEALDMISRPYNYASTARVDRLHARDCVLFLGDSAHAVSASVGQACNAALQDVAKFDEVLTETNDHWHRSLLKFTERRLKDILALHELSDYSLPNPKDKWIQTEFIFRAITRKVLPTFISKYMSPMPNELLSTTNLSYSEILEQTEWWTEKVKRSMQATNGYGSDSSAGTSSGGGGGGLKRSPKSGNISLLDPSKRKMVRVR